MTYRKKPVTVEAIRFALTNQNEVIEWTLTGRPPLAQLPAYPYLGSIAVNTDSGPQYALPGDWIVRDAKGWLSVCKPEEFEASYEPVT